MKKFLNRDERRLIAFFTLGFAFIYAVSWTLFGNLSTVLALPLMLFIMMTGMVFGFRKQRKTLLNTAAQMQAFAFINQKLDLRYPLPPLGDAALSPDCAGLLIGLIKENKPQTIVELGSGVSTLIAAYCLEAQGSGKIVSLDHDAFYGDITQNNLQQHGLTSMAEVKHAPITPVTINNETWQWYNAEALESISRVDMLIVDGPPRHIQALSRYPALPLLLEKLSPNALVLIDDAHRSDEIEIIRRWQPLLKGFKKASYYSEKGTVVFKRQAAL